MLPDVNLCIDPEDEVNVSCPQEEKSKADIQKTNCPEDAMLQLVHRYHPVIFDGNSFHSETSACIALHPLLARIKLDF